MEGVESPPMPSSPSSFFSPLLISMLGIVLTSIAIIIYHLFLVKYCLRRHAASASANATAQNANANVPPTGVDQKVLDTIPIFTYAKVKHDMDHQFEECVVCLGELEDEDEVRLLPYCNHAFHVTCIDQWFVAHTSCPLCRSPILDQTNLEPYPLDSHVAVNNNSDREISGGESSTSSNSIRESSPRAQSFGLLRHCASMVVPPPVDRRPPTPSGLKRSLSMDPSLVVTNLHTGDSLSAPASSSSRNLLTRSGSFSIRSLSNFDRVPSKWLRSFSLLRLGKKSNETILPY